MFRFFIAGIMQGSKQDDDALHCQQYRQRVIELLNSHFDNADIYDPFANHQDSVGYEDERGRKVFLDHNQMCSDVDVLIAFVPEASMGTAIEMWQAHQNGRFVVTISPLLHNWSIKFLSHVIYADEKSFQQAIVTDELTELVRSFYENQQ